MASAVDAPGRVCSVLFSPQLAAAYGRWSHSGCVRYFEHVSDSPVNVEGVFRSGATAVIELRERDRPRMPWSIVLTRRSGGGWQAVDLISGQS